MFEQPGPDDQIYSFTKMNIQLLIVLLYYKFRITWIEMKRNSANCFEAIVIAKRSCFTAAITQVKRAINKENISFIYN